MRNTFAFAGPQWEQLYLQRVRRNAHVSAIYRQYLVPINYGLPVGSLEIDDLSGCEVTLAAPNTSRTFRHNVAQHLLNSGANMVAAVCDCGSISIYRIER